MHDSVKHRTAHRKKKKAWWFEYRMLLIACYLARPSSNPTSEWRKLMFGVQHFPLKSTGNMIFQFNLCWHEHSLFRSECWDQLAVECVVDQACRHQPPRFDRQHRSRRPFLRHVSSATNHSASDRLVALRIKSRFNVCRLALATVCNSTFCLLSTLLHLNQHQQFFCIKSVLFNIISKIKVARTEHWCAF